MNKIRDFIHCLNKIIKNLWFFIILQISFIVDINRIPHILKVTPSNPHDSFRNIYLLKQVYVSKLINKQKKCFSIFLFVESKIMEEIIEENHFSKPINLIEDKGYIKSNK